MRPMMFVLLAVALVIAGLAAVLANRFVGGNQAAQAPPPSAPAKMVLVVTRDLTAGATITDKELQWQDWPEARVNPRFIVRGTGEDPRSTYVGSMTRTAFAAGEPLQSSRVFKQENAGVMAGLLTPGMRAVAITTSAAKGAAGFILPNDRVDVVLSGDIKLPANVPMPDNLVKSVAETILRDLRVLAVDQTVGEGKKAAVVAKVVTLEVTSRQAEMLILAQDVGGVNLVLRSLAAGTEREDEVPYMTDLFMMRSLRDALGAGAVKTAQPAPPPPPVDFEMPPSPPVTFPQNDAPPSRSVKIYRGGSASTQTFSE